MALHLKEAWDCHAHLFGGLVLAGSHYTPPDCTLEMWSKASGFGHVVLVQPSVYGTNNRLLVDALKHSQGKHRGVVVIDASTTDAELREMHDAGVRGVRFNLVSPVGAKPDDMDSIVARVAPLNWHVQFYAAPSHYPQIAACQKRWSVPIVLDHMAGFRVDTPFSPEAAAQLRALGEAGAWIKCSGFYRLGMASPYEKADALLRHMLHAFRGRMVWASDWPNTWFMEPARAGTTPPTFAELLGPLKRVFDEDTLRDILVEAPRRLYR